jgi:hypothetical protein
MNGKILNDFKRSSACPGALEGGTEGFSAEPNMRPALRAVFTILALAGVYFVAGKLGLSLA